MVTYSLYLQQLDSALKSTTLLVESNHNHFTGNYSGLLSYDSFKAFKIKLSESSDIEKFSSVAFSSDSIGKNIICNKYKKDFTKEEEIFSN